MKLNPDCLRDILIAYEGLPAHPDETPLEIPGYSEDELFVHQRLLEDAGYIKLQVLEAGDDQIFIIPSRLTYSGHEFLNASRNQANWNKVKKTFEKSGGFVIEVAKSLLLEYLKQQLHP